MSPRPLRLLAGSLLAGPLLVVAGCGGPDVDEPGYRARVQDAATSARTEVDALAEEVGSRPRPGRDELVACEREGEEGRRVAYSVRIEVGGDARAVAGNPLRDRYESQGWAVSYRGETTVLFQRSGTQLVLIIEPGAGSASVGGTGGCVV